MNKNHTILIFGLSVFTTLLAVGLLIFFFKVIQNKNEHTSVVLATLKEKVDQKENAKILEKRLLEIESTRLEIENYFVDLSRIDTFVSYLEELGSGVGVNLSVKNVEISKTNKNLVLLRISMKGTFSEVMRAITLIENAPYQINITQVYLNKGIKKTSPENPDNKTQNSTWQADITFNVLSSS